MEQTSRRDFVSGAGAAALIGGAAMTAGARPSVRALSASDGSLSDQKNRSLASITTTGGDGKQIIPGSPYATFSRAVRLDKLVFVAGVVGQKPGTRELAGGGFEAEARQAMENLKASVEASGSRMVNVLKCSVFIKDADDFATFNKVYITFFPKDPPARSSVVVKDLVVPGANLEIDCVTYVD